MGFSEKNYQKEIGNMERWKEVFAGIIPKAVYQMQLINGEKQGLTIELSSGHTCVRISFGAVLAVRMLDEGIVDRKSTRLNSSHKHRSRMPSSA